MGPVRGRAFWAAAVIISAALVVAGCGGGGNEASGTGGAKATPVSTPTCDQQPTGGGQFTIVSDLPLQGSSRLQTEQMVAAIKYVLQERQFKAGDYTVQYQSCDDSTAQAGKWDSATCSANAKAYASNSSVIGVIGTFNSGCAALEIPIANKAPEGPLAMVSPANTYVCLTHGGPGCASTEPDQYYPNQTRNYARVVAADDFQGAANALLTQELGIKNIYILNDKEAYGQGVAENFQRAAESLGIGIAGNDAWDGKAANYQALMNKIKSSGADGIFLGGLICENGGQLIKDKVAVLGANDGAVKLLSPDGFTTDATINGEGSAGPENAEGMYMSVAGVPADQLTGAGQEFIAGFKAAQGLDAVEPYTAYAAQAVEVLLTAIEKSDGTRASVAQNLFNLQITDGILGDFQINADGDTDSNPITFFIVHDGAMETYKVLTPDPSLVATA